MAIRKISHQIHHWPCCPLIPSVTRQVSLSGDQGIIPEMRSAPWLMITSFASCKYLSLEYLTPYFSYVVDWTKYEVSLRNGRFHVTTLSFGWEVRSPSSKSSTRSDNTTHQTLCPLTQRSAFIHISLKWSVSVGLCFHRNLVSCWSAWKKLNAHLLISLWIVPADSHLLHINFEINVCFGLSDE